jgi:hypothetical protein
MTAWGVGFIPFNVQVKVECDEDFAIMIWATQTGMQRCSKVIGWSKIRNLHLIR